MCKDLTDSGDRERQGASRRYVAAVAQRRLAPCRSLFHRSQFFVLLQPVRHLALLAIAVQFAAGPLSRCNADDEVVASATLSKASVQIAEPFDLTISVKANIGTKVSFPAVQAMLGDLEVSNHQDQFDLPAPNDSDRRTWTRRLTLESLVTGELVIPSLEIQARSDSESQLLRTDELAIDVVSVLENQADPMKFRDIKNVADVEIPQSQSYAWIGWILGGMGGIAGLSFAGVKLATRKKWTSPETWAIDELEKLSQSKELSNSDAASVFARLETTLRYYLESQLSISATSLSAAKLIEAVSTKLKSLDENSPLDKLLRDAELARYAGRSFSKDELEVAIDNAAAFVKRVDSYIGSSQEQLAIEQEVH